MWLMILSIIASAVFLGIAIYALVDEEPEGFLIMMILTLAVIILCIGVPMFASYNSYVDMKKTYEATISQYRNSVEMYEDKAVINVNEDSFTDFKYKGYQENIAQMIRDIRNKVESYNNKYIGKQEFGSNPLFSWYIVGPSEDMKLIRLKTGGGMPNKKKE